jgi:hypothetical protein
MFKNFRSVALFAFISLLFAAPVFAQFEVSPDHFDAAPAHVPQKVRHTKTAHKTAATTTRTASGVGTQGKQQLAKRRKPAHSSSEKTKTKASL